jgi:hypothetical protein
MVVINFVKLKILYVEFLYDTLFCELFSQCLLRVANLLSTVLLDIDSNVAESFNSVCNSYLIN